MRAMRTVRAAACAAVILSGALDAQSPGPLQRLLSPAPFILKGEGWYVTDYPSEARKKARDAEKSATTSTGAASGEKSSTSSAKETSTTTSDSAAASSPAEKPSS